MYITEDLEQLNFLLQQISLFILTMNMQYYASIHAYASFSSGHAIYTWDRKATIIAICKQKLAATSTFSSSPSLCQRIRDLFL